MRLWTPADMTGITALEYFDSTQGVVTGAMDNGSSPLQNWTAVRPSGGTATRAVSFRDDFRPVISSVNNRPSVYFDASTRQLSLDTGNLPSGPGNKFWFIATKNLETRSGDYYPWGYGGGSGTSATWKMSRGQTPYADIGSVGFAIGNVAIAATGISIITESYTQANTTTRSWYNGQVTPTSYNYARNTSASNARLGHWPLYGNGANQHLLRLGWCLGTPSVEDILRLQGWLSWDTGDQGFSLAADHPYKSAAPTVEDSTTGLVLNGSVQEENDIVASLGSVRITASVTNYVDADDTVVSTAYLKTIASGNLIEDSDIISSTGYVSIKTSANIVEADDMVSAGQIQLKVQARGSIVEDNDIVSSTTRVAIKASSNITEESDIISSSLGNILALNGNILEDSDVITSVVKVRVSASGSISEANDIVTSVGTVAVTIPITTPEGRRVVLPPRQSRDAILISTIGYKVSLQPGSSRRVTLTPSLARGIKL